MDKTTNKIIKNILKFAPHAKLQVEVRGGFLVVLDQNNEEALTRPLDDSGVRQVEDYILVFAQEQDFVNG